MKRHDSLIRLSQEHHQALVLSLRIERELPEASDEAVGELYDDLLFLWTQGLLPHFHAEHECLLARLVRHMPAEDPRARRLQDDHLRIEALVATMRDAGDMAVRRDALAHFGEQLRDHIRWEERAWFPLLEETLTPEELAQAKPHLDERLPAEAIACPAPRGVPGRSADGDG